MDSVLTRPASIALACSVMTEYEQWTQELVGRLVAVEQDLVGATGETDKAIASREEALRQIKTRDAKIAALETEIGKANQLIDAQVARFEGLQGIPTHTDDLAQIEQLKADLAKASTGLGTAHGESDLLASQVEELRAKLVHATDGLDAAKAELAERNDEVKGLKDKLNHANSSKARSEKRNEENRKKAVDAERVAREKVKEVESVLVARDKELDKVKGELAKARDAAKRKESLTRKNNKLHSEQVDRLVAEKERMEKQLDAMIAKADGAEARASALQSQVDNDGGDATALQRKIMDSMRESEKIAAGGVRIALDKLTDPDGDYTLDATDPIIEKLRVAQQALAGDLAEQEER